MWMVQHWSLWSTYVVFRVEIGAKLEKHARDISFGVFACVMKRRFSSFLKVVCSHATRDVRRVSTYHTFCATERNQTLFATLGFLPIFTSSSTTGT
jgi:hypothetical protein